ncbi:STAS domain-containing protein [Solwaraspora sp. WMMD1047]|uniref:STAS domain-containing protein n=1 Tax=Solwaraspora sp. WMMD1047 TaxID=3016102 RepID=UPI0024166B4A|nr:STAS domain-containing protein [Solwaraspora sp. WMMD1047]MDG4832807.1 STAS domain-containing protein [Solwaraspora sp. WMMD1047]
MNDAYSPLRDAAEPVLRIDIDPTPDNGVALRLLGDLDLDSAARLPRLVDSLLTDPAPDALTIDLSGLVFCDSSGIHALLNCRERVAEAGCRFAVVRPRPQVLRVLELTGVAALLGLSAGDAS